MSNTLTKELTRTITPGSPGVPSSPGSPAIPAYTYVVETEVLEPIYAPAPIPNTGYSLDRIIGYRKVIKKTFVTVPGKPAVPPSPGTPGTPATEVANYGFGWNAGARSIEAMPRDGAFRFQAAGVGVVVGLAKAAATAAEKIPLGVDAIIFGVYVNNTKVNVVYGGDIVLTLFGYSLADELKVERRGADYRFSINGNVAHVQAGAAEAGPLRLLTTMFSGGDTVVDALYLRTTTGTGDFSFEPLVTAGGEGPQPAVGAFSLRRLLVGGGDGIANLVGPTTESDALYEPYRNFGQFVMEPTAFLGSENSYRYGAFAMPPMEMVALSSDSPAYRPPLPSRGFFVTPPLGMSGRLLAKKLGQGAFSFPYLETIGSDRRMGQGRFSMEPMQVYANAYEAELGTFMFSTAAAVNVFEPTMIALAVIDANANITGVLTFQRLGEAEMTSEWAAQLVLTANSIAAAILFSEVDLQDSAPPDGLEGAAWAVNNEGASPPSMYENFAFNSFAYIGGRHFGMRADGLYELTGDDDAGDEIQAMLGIGNRDFGTPNLKALTDVYIGGSSTGKMVLRVKDADGTWYTYEADSFNETMKVTRFQTGLGLRANYFDIELRNQNGNQFTVDTMEFLLGKTSRRIGG